MPPLGEQIVIVACAEHLLPRRNSLARYIVFGVLQHLRNVAHRTERRRRNGEAETLNDRSHAEMRVGVDEARSQCLSF